MRSLSHVRARPQGPSRASRRVGSPLPSPYSGKHRKLLTEKSGENVKRTANLRTKILDFGRFDSSRILILRGGGILMSIGESWKL